MSAVSNIARARIANGQFDWTALDVRALLLDGFQATDPDRDFVSQLSGEVVGTGYARVILSGKAEVRDNPNDLVRCTADEVAWDPLDVGTVDRMVLFVQVATDTDSWVVSYHDVRTASGNPVVTSGGRLAVPPHGTYGYVAIR